MRRGRQHTWLGLSVVMALLPALSAPAAFGAEGSWEFETQTYDFGSALPGSHTSHQFVVTNTGESPITGGGWVLRWRLFGPGDPELFHVISNGCRGATLGPEESCSIGLSFNPTHPGPKEGQLELASDPRSAPNVKVGLEGEANGPVAAIEPNLLLLGVVAAGAGFLPHRASSSKTRATSALRSETSPSPTLPEPHNRRAPSASPAGPAGPRWWSPLKEAARLRWS